MGLPRGVRALLVVVHLLAVAPAAGALEHPLEGSTVVVGPDGRLTFRARWSGSAPGLAAPSAVTSALTVTAGDGARTVVPLAPARWRSLPQGRGFRYRDARAESGAVRAVVLRLRRQGGALRLRGHGQAFAAPPSPPIVVTLTIDTVRWCAEFAGPFRPAARGLVAHADGPPASCPCTEPVVDTWRFVQRAVLDRHACTQPICHGGSPGAAGLDLRAEVAYRSLLNVPSTGGGIVRVLPGDPEGSFLWRKLAARTLGLPGVPGSPMPIGDPLTEDELDAIGLWISAGAPETGLVPAADRLLGSCLPPPLP